MNGPVHHHIAPSFSARASCLVQDVGEICIGTCHNLDHLHRIDDDSGVGTQLVVADHNKDKLPDLVVANKKGIFVFTHKTKKVTKGGLAGGAAEADPLKPTLRGAPVF